MALRMCVSLSQIVITTQFPTYVILRSAVVPTATPMVFQTSVNFLGTTATATNSLMNVMETATSTDCPMSVRLIATTTEFLTIVSLYPIVITMAFLTSAKHFPTATKTASLTCVMSGLVV